ncbi:hypothetical protein EIL50_02600 [bacterium NHP-B]|nr:hypothetical protein EIL50_02600 [bacterium NHP-B]
MGRKARTLLVALFVFVWLPQCMYAPPQANVPLSQVRPIGYVDNRTHFRGFSFSVFQGFETWGTPIPLTHKIKYSDDLAITGFRGGLALGYFFEIYNGAFFLEAAAATNPMKEVNIGQIFDNLQPMVTLRRSDVSASGTLGLGSKLTKNTAFFLIAGVDAAMATIDVIDDPEAFVQDFNNRTTYEPPITANTVLPKTRDTSIDMPATPPAPPAPYAWATDRFTQPAQGLSAAISDMNQNPYTMTRKRLPMITGRLGFRIASMVNEHVSFQIEFAGRWSHISMPNSYINTIKTSGIDCQIRLGYHF